MHHEQARSFSARGSHDAASPRERQTQPDCREVTQIEGDRTRRLRGAVPGLLSAAEWSNLVAALRLTEREADILRAMFYDERATSLAKRLNLTPNTIHTYRKRLLLKLDVRSMTLAVAHVFALYVHQKKVEELRISDEGS